MVEALDVFGNVTATDPQITLTSTPAAINVQGNRGRGSGDRSAGSFSASRCTYTLTASANGVAPANSNSFAIRGPTTVSLSSSLNPARYGQGVTLTAAVSPASATGLVTFYDGATVLGESILSGGPAQLTTTLLPSGAGSLWGALRRKPGFTRGMLGKNHREREYGSRKFAAAGGEL